MSTLGDDDGWSGRVAMVRRDRRNGRGLRRIHRGWSLIGRLGPDVSRVVVQSPRDDGAFVGEPGIENWSFGVSVLIFQLADVEIDLLGRRRIAPASFQSVE